jgi:hypothetical protein
LDRLGFNSSFGSRCKQARGTETRDCEASVARSLVVGPRAIERRPNMGKTNEENVKTGQQETNEPWKKPDRSDHHPDKDSPNPRPRRPEDNKTA